MYPYLSSNQYSILCILLYYIGFIYYISFINIRVFDCFDYYFYIETDPLISKFIYD